MLRVRFITTILIFLTLLLGAFLLPNLRVEIPRDWTKTEATEQNQNLVKGEITSYEVSPAAGGNTVTATINLVGQYPTDADFQVLLQEKLRGINAADVTVAASFPKNDKNEDDKTKLNVTLGFPRLNYQYDYDQVARYILTSANPNLVMRRNTDLALNFNLLGIDSILANFRKGDGIYPSTVLTYNANVDAVAAERDFDLISKRLENTKLTDVEVRLVVGETRKIEFTFPDYYGQEFAKHLAGILTAPGVLSLKEHNAGATDVENQKDQILSNYFGDYVAVDSELKIGDVVNVQVESKASLGTYVWRVTFNPSISTILEQALAAAHYPDPLTGASTGELKPLTIFIDGQAGIVMNIRNGNELFGVPILYNGDSITMQALTGYFFDNIGVLGSWKLEDETSILPAEYLGKDGRIFLAGTFILAFVALSVFAFSRLRLKAAIRFMWIWGLWVLLSLSFFKLIAVPISINFLTVFICLFAVMAAWSWEFAMLTENDYLLRSRSMRRASLWLILGLCLIYMSGLVSGVVLEAIGIVVIGLIAVYLLTIVGWRQICYVTSNVA